MIRARILQLCWSAAVGPDYQRVSTTVPKTIPAINSGELEQKDNIDVTWWKIFNDNQLNAMVKTAFEHNLDLQVALARVDEFRASLGVAKSDFYPSLSLSAGASRQKLSDNQGIPVPAGYDTYNNFMLGLNLNYEIDFWGKVRRSNEAARAELFQYDFNRANVQLTLISQVVTTYFSLRSLDLQLEIARDTYVSRKDSFDLMSKQFKGGLVSELSTRQAESEMYSAAVSVSVLESSISRTESALAILLGRNPKEIFESPVPRGKNVRELIVPPTLPMLLPSKLLERRPDIASAEQQLIAANARIGLAKSYYFPSISLTGGLGYQSTELNNLFQGPSQTWSFGANLLMPIFDAGRTGYLVEAATARQKQALAQYQKSIQVAFTEVRDALKDYDSGKIIIDMQKTQVEALQRNLYLANLRYKNGQSTYLDVLDAERQLFQVQLASVQAQQNRLVSVVNLYKALGGGWVYENQEAQK